MSSFDYVFHCAMGETTQGNYVSLNVTNRDPWDVDPLRLIPDPTDQVVYFAASHIILYFVCFAVLLIGIWQVYYAAREKKGIADGVITVIWGMVMMAFVSVWGGLQYYLQQADVASLSWLQGVELQIAGFLYRVCGPSGGLGHLALMYILIALSAAMPIVLTAFIASDSGRRKAEKARQGEIEDLNSRISELESKLVMASAAAASKPE